MRDGRFIVADVTRVREGPDGVEATIVNTATQDGPAVRVGLPQDPGQAGKQQVLYLTRKLAGYRVESSPESGDKETRASPFASQVNVGNVCILRSEWNSAYLDELASFPGGLKDDQVDASSRAFAMISERPAMVITPSKYAQQARAQAMGARARLA
jgi:predicted phage terminase large subunit-like protein